MLCLTEEIDNVHVHMYTTHKECVYVYVYMYRYVLHVPQSYRSSRAGRAQIYCTAVEQVNFREM